MALQNNYPLYRDVIYAFSPSVGSTAISAHGTFPYRAKVVKVESVLGAPITSGDCVVTTSISTTAMTGGTLTIANSSSASGDVDSAIPTAGNIGQEGDVISFNPSGASGTTVPGHFRAYIIPA